MKLAFISDTHGLHRHATIPECDILFHCGDLSGRGEHHIYEDVAKWMDDPVRQHVIVPGNHDTTFESVEEKSREIFEKHGIHVLIDQGVTINGLKIWGCPWTLRFFDWAFNASPGEEMSSHLSKIPYDLDVLITHGPAYGFGDWIPGRRDLAQDVGCFPAIDGRGKSVGCPQLLNAIYEKKPRIHAYGHIHEGAGMCIMPDIETISINASFLDGKYRVKHNPVVVDYTK